MAELMDAFQESDLPFKVDVVDWATTKPSFRRSIERSKFVVKSRAGDSISNTKWRPIRLGNLCVKVGSGATPRGGKEVYLQHGPVAFIRSQNVRNDRFEPSGLAYITHEQASLLDGVAVEVHDVLLNITGDSVARCAQVNARILPARVSQHVSIIRPDSTKLDPHFLKYYLIAPQVQRHLLQLASAGATRPALTKSMIESLPVFAPTEISEQRAIAGILGALDDKIELNRKTSETLEAMARALFKSWFIDFDPVRARAEGRNPGLTPEIASLFPDSFVESELGELPTGWRVGSLGTVAVNVRRAISYKAIPAGTPYIGLEHMPRRSIALDCWEHSTQIESNKSQFRQGEFLFGKLRPYFHKVGVAPVTGVCSTDIIVVSSISVEWGAFVLFHLSSNELIAHADRCSTGTRMPRTSWEHIARYDVAVPPATIAQSFTKIVAPIVERIVAAIHESRNLAELRDALLPKLISGEIRVPEAERTVEKAI